MRVALFGAGRIGEVHAQSLFESPSAELAWVADLDLLAAERLAKRHDARATSNPRDALDDASVEAVVIATPTPTHVDLIVAAARAGKSIFCEKPIDLDLSRVDAAIVEVERAGVPLFVGFNRRFDPSFQRLKRDLATGEIGELESVIITSRDPQPPSHAYLESSGGLFRDMTIHDFDMARWLLAEEPTEIFATGSVLVDPEIGAHGDIDTAMVVLRTASGRLCHINNSRRAVYGYDQRIEVFGSRGMLMADNLRHTTVVRFGEDGIIRDRPPNFFIERYREAYRAEMAHFLAGAGDEEAALLVGPHDGRQALVLANAAYESLRSGRFVPVR